MITAHHRISKYAPGVDLETTWTGRPDIGVEIDGRVLSEDEYLEVENKYLYAHTVFLQQAGVTALSTFDVSLTSHVPDQWRELADGQSVPVADVPSLLRAMLREQVSLRLESDDYYLHVGYDMWTFVGTAGPVPYAVEQARSVGLFVDEGVESPYIPDPADRFWWLDEGAPVHWELHSFRSADGEPLDTVRVPAEREADVLAAVPNRPDDPKHWDRYPVRGYQLERVAELLGVRLNPDADYMLNSHSDS